MAPILWSLLSYNPPPNPARTHYTRLKLVLTWIIFTNKIFHGGCVCVALMSIRGQGSGYLCIPWSSYSQKCCFDKIVCGFVSRNQMSSVRLYVQHRHLTRRRTWFCLISPKAAASADIGTSYRHESNTLTEYEVGYEGDGRCSWICCCKIVPTCHKTVHAMCLKCVLWGKKIQSAEVSDI